MIKQKEESVEKQEEQISEDAKSEVDEDEVVESKETDPDDVPMDNNNADPEESKIMSEDNINDEGTAETTEAKNDLNNNDEH